MKSGLKVLQTVLMAAGVLSAVLLMTGCSNAPGSGSGSPVSGPDVYVGGSYQNGTGNFYACYWKNGVVTTLTNVISDVWGLAVDGAGNVYVGGGYYNNSGIRCACYWKNGAVTTLTNVISDVWGLSIDGAGNVYTCGICSNISKTCSNAC
ncbi:MAG: hypothetical protein ABSG94_10630, partial [Brevinematales bacterium]